MRKTDTGRHRAPTCPFSARSVSERRAGGFTEFSRGRLQPTLKAQSARRPDKKRGEFPRSRPDTLPRPHSLSTPLPFLLLSAVTVATTACEKNRGSHVNTGRFPRQRDNGNLIAYLSLHRVFVHISVAKFRWSW